MASAKRVSGLRWHRPSGRLSDAVGFAFTHRYGGAWIWACYSISDSRPFIPGHFLCPLHTEALPTNPMSNANLCHLTYPMFYGPSTNPSSTSSTTSSTTPSNPRSPTRPLATACSTPSAAACRRWIFPRARNCSARSFRGSRCRTARAFPELPMSLTPCRRPSTSARSSAGWTTTTPGSPPSGATPATTSALSSPSSTGSLETHQLRTQN